MTDARDELAEVVESFLMDASREFYSYRSVAGVVGLETGYGNEPVMIDCHALADAILAAGWRAPLPDREHVWAQWPAEQLPNGRRARTHLRCARCQLWYSQWHGDNDCPE